MTDYEHIWGNASKQWCNINFKEKQISSALLALAWIGMISFFIFAAFTILTKSDVAAILMIASILVWLAGGIAIVRMRRTQKKLVTFQK
jgi:hypothetical protein